MDSQELPTTCVHESATQLDNDTTSISNEMPAETSDVAASTPGAPKSKREMLATKVPVEIQQMIISHLHPPQNERWTKKTDLKNFRWTCKNLAAAALEELYRDMTLTFYYEYDTRQVRWKVPNLVDWLKHNDDFKASVKAMKLAIVPISEAELLAMRADAAQKAVRQLPPFNQVVQDPEVLRYKKGRASNELEWAGEETLPDAIKNMQYHLQPTSDRAPCVFKMTRNPSRADNDDPQSAQFTRSFGRANGDSMQPVEEIFHPLHGDKIKRQVFADYILCIFRQFLEDLKGVQHLAVGSPCEGEGYEIHESWNAITAYGLLFSIAILCKDPLPPNIKSLAVFAAPYAPHHFLPRPSTLLRYCTDMLQAQLNRLPLPHLSISLGLRDRMVLPLNVAWKESLTSLKIARTDSPLRKLCGSRHTPADTNLPILLSRGRFPNVLALCLANWVVRAEVLKDELPEAFPKLKTLRLEGVTLSRRASGRPEAEWREIVRVLEEKYGRRLVLMRD